MPKLSLTQPDAIQRGHSTALLQQDVLLGRGALGLPPDALHGLGEGWGAVPPLQGSLLIQELRLHTPGCEQRAAGQRRAGEGRVRPGVGLGERRLLLRTLDARLRRGECRQLPR